MNRIVIGASLGGGFIALIFAFASGNVIAALLSSFLLFLSLLLWKYGYLLIPFFTQSAKIIEKRGDYEIPPSRDCIIKKSGEGYYASKFLEIRFYESALEKGESEKQYLFEAFERMLGSLKNVVKISLLIGAVDLSKHIDEIKTKRSAAEAKKAQGKLDEADRVRIDREIAYWNRLLERLSKGEKPIEIIAYAHTTAFGLTRDEAISRATRQAKEIKTIISSALGCEVEELKDLEMIKCFEWEKFYPVSMEEIKDELF